MSYIKNDNNGLFLNTITDAGRKAIARGDFNFKYFSLGDSEINYDCSNQNSKILHPKVKNYYPVSYLNKDKTLCNPLYSIDKIENINLLVKSKQIEKGFFSSCNPITGKFKEEHLKGIGITKINNFNGLKEVNLGDNFIKSSFIEIEDGDVLVLKIRKFQTDDDLDEGETPNTVETTIEYENTERPHQYLFFNIKRISLSNDIELDRFSPDFSQYSGHHKIYFFILSNKSNINAFYNSENNGLPEWNNGELEFTDCDVECNPIWYNNNVFCEDIIGSDNNTCSYTEFNSQEYCGTLNLLSLCEECIEEIPCQDKNKGVTYKNNDDYFIIHYNNESYKNVYGDFLHIDDNDSLKVTFPTVMWHNRYFETERADNMGMSFMSSSEIKTIENTTITYYDLVEDNSLIAENTNPLIVGKIFPHLHLIIITDQELLNVMKYKSNRNWSLPSLNVTAYNDMSNGLIETGKVLYITYMLESNDEIQYSFPCGYIQKIENKTPNKKSVDFSIDNSLHYMFSRDFNNGYEGFHANKIKILYQIKDIDVKPTTDAWNVIDMTSSHLTMNNSGSDIIPQRLNEQNSYVTQFKIDDIKAMQSTEIYDLENYCIFCDNFTMGNEQVFLGNVSAKAGSVIYKTKIIITIDNEFAFTSNKTYTEGDFYLSDIGIYNEDKQLMMVSKLSFPLPINNNDVTRLEISMDF